MSVNTDLPPGVTIAEDFDDEPEPRSIPFTEMDPELPKGRSRRQGKIAKELESLYATMGTMAYPFNPRVGATVIQQAGPCAEALEELARSDPRVRRALEALLTTGAWSAVIAAHLPIMVVIATEYVPYIRDSYNASSQPSAESTAA